LKEGLGVCVNLSSKGADEYCIAADRDVTNLRRRDKSIARRAGEDFFVVLEQTEVLPTNWTTVKVTPEQLRDGFGRAPSTETSEASIGVGIASRVLSNIPNSNCSLKDSLKIVRVLVLSPDPGILERPWTGEKPYAEATMHSETPNV
jgi:hypothetical protein